MRHLTTDLRGNPIYVMSRSARLRSRFSHHHLPTLFYLIRNRAWQSVIARAESHPNEVTVQEAVSENTCLHNACRLDPPTEVIRALQVCSRMKNAEGCTPLHIAVSHMMSAASLEALLEVAAAQPAPAQQQPKAHLYRTSIYAHDSFKSQHPTADLSRCGRAPIHMACLSFRGLEATAFQLLLEATLNDGNINVDDSQEALGLDDFFNEDDLLSQNSSSGNLLDDPNDTYGGTNGRVVNVMTLRDTTGQTPLGLLFRRYRERIRIVISRVDRLWREHNDNPSKASLAAAISVQAELGELWQRARYLMGRLEQERLQKEDDGRPDAPNFYKPYGRSTGKESSSVLIDMDQPLSPGEIAVAQEAAAWSAEKHNMAQNFESAEALEKEARDESSPQNRRSSSPARSFRIVHASVGLIGYGCPPEMIRLAISIHPNQVKEMDEDGNLPIHIASTARSYLSAHYNAVNTSDKSTLEAAAAAAVAASDEDSMVSDTTGVLSFFSTATVSQAIHAFDKVIKILLQHYPESAKIPQGKTGRLPLVMAVEAGCRSWDDGLQTLLAAYPPALHGNSRGKMLSLPLYANVLAMVNDTAPAGDGSCKNNSKHYPAGGAGVAIPSHPSNQRVGRPVQRGNRSNRKNKTSRKLTTMFELLKVKPELVSGSATCSKLNGSDTGSC